jgi:flagellar biosynthesis protein FlhB
MASEDTSRDDRHLPATEKRLREAAQDGQVARSRDAAHAFVIVAALMAISYMGPKLADDLLQLTRQALALNPAKFQRPELMMAQLLDLGAQALWFTAPMMALMAAAGAVGSVLPGGFNWAPKAAGINWGKLSPMAGFGRIFSGQSVIELSKLVIVALALLVLGLWYAVKRLPDVAALGEQTIIASSTASLAATHSVLGWLAGALFLVATIDLPWQWFRHRDNLKMSHQEQRQEAKEAEGDPQMKGRIRSKQREMSRSRMLSAVPSADVVITNPTHFSVALRYDPENMVAPRVVAKGADELAFRIREVARESGVVLMEAPPLARALYKHSEVDSEIPAALFGAVAQVLAYVYQLRQFVPGLGKAPEEPRDLGVPLELDPGAPSA